MKFYLSSFKLGNNYGDLKRLVKNKRIGLIPNAIDNLSKDKVNFHISNSLRELEQLGLEPEILDLKEYFGRYLELENKLNELKAVWVNGGNTFILRQAMKLSGFDRYVQTHLDDDNFTYGGFSAGICVLAPNLKGLQQVDKPDEFPYVDIKETIWEGLGVLDYLILPHYNSDHSESADIDKEVEYCIENKIPYKTLRDGEVIILE